MNLLTKKDHFLFLAILAFVFISSTALALSRSYNFTKIYQIVVKGEDKKYPPNPVLKQNSTFPVLSAQGVLVADLNSGVTLYEKNADQKLLPASTTKIVTALVALDYYPLNQVITVGPEVRVVGQKMGLFKGEQMKVEDLLYGLLVYSANDAAEVLANNYCAPKGPEQTQTGETVFCGYDAFIYAMNKKANELSMINSHFDNPVGLDTEGQYATVRDLVRVSEVAMRNPTFAKIVGTKQVTFKDVTGKFAYNLNNINALLGSVPGVLGVKTGWTENARENLVTYIERDGHKVMIAVLGSQDRFGETKELIDWIFSSYEWQEVNPYSP
ncbi:MAG: D-alanyl-D-alanine carboxypeptidase [Candidatus Woesebacteria bacterium]|nr:MAG: D-alanyl-D-alanine carboxypeptidase [Candidatus Woesebacteria bacterium]